VTSRTVCIGVTGPIGCGKSTVAQWLAARGAIIIDADTIAREVTQPGEPALDAVLATFGREVRNADGSLNRRALASIVFADAAALASLESIIHPAVRPRVVDAIGAARRAGAPAVVVEAIKLVEGGLATVCDEVWLVTCAPDVQRERLAERGVEDEDAQRRITSQAGMVDRIRAQATRVIDTTAARDVVDAQVARLYEEAIARPA
jgi:dephospho-CoA kinase